MLKLDLAIQIAREFGYSDSDTDLNDDFLLKFLDWVDEIYIEICNETDWELSNQGLFELTAIQNQAFLDLPSGILNIISMQRKDNQYKVHYKEQKYFFDHNWDLERTGPIEYWFYNNYTASGDSSIRQIRFVAIPDSNVDLLIYANKALNESIGSAEHIPLPSNFLPCLKHSLRSISFRNEEELEKANYYEQKYQVEMLKVKKKLSTLKGDIIQALPGADLRNIPYNNFGLLQVPDGNFV